MVALETRQKERKTEEDGASDGGKATRGESKDHITEEIRKTGNDSEARLQGTL